MPQYYPLFLDLTGLPVLVVGGGAVGLRKVRTLLQHKARVTVVAVAASAALRQMAARGRIVLHERPYRASDLHGRRLVFVATNDRALNRRIRADAQRRGILTNVVDDPELCDFIVPSIVRRGSLVVAVSTEGACPAYAKRLRRELENQFDPAYGQYVALLGSARRAILQQATDPQKSVRVLNWLLDAGLLDWIRRKGLKSARKRMTALLKEWLDAAL
ncbi:MAG: bifunctional precorrin-2 dehydrogenase/sirohydrochlorin ferrochelatase [Candidatus Sumerlaeia bacterium]|nr:bifunctional precorrin-2 dehydrogenase/sirohydrochlorin ferrochelatase [Candidatus Sumerlaeia bacterium]